MVVWKVASSPPVWATSRSASNRFRYRESKSGRRVQSRLPLFFALHSSFTQYLYGTKFLLVLILALTVMTFSVQMLKSTFLQLGADLEEAGRVNGGSFWFTLRHILLPLMLPAIAVVAVMVFGSVSRQVGSIVLLTTGESEPLSVLQMGYLMAEDYSAAAVVGTLLVSMGVLLALLARKSGQQFGLHQT